MDRNELYAQRLEIITEHLHNGDDEFEEKLLELEEEIKIAMRESFEEEEEAGLSGLLAEIKSTKEEFDFYDEEGELDMMFPDRHDEDFDEDSMSYDSVFGDE